MATQQHATVTLRLTRTFAAPRERVFRAWTTPQQLKRWSAPADFTNSVVEVDLRVGGRYKIGMQAPDGTAYTAVGAYQVVDPPKKLVYPWRWESEGAEETLVTVEFHDR